MEILEHFMSAVIEHQPVWVWLVFFGVVTFILVLDLGVLERDAKVIGAKKSLLLFSTYASIAALFGGWIYLRFGNEMAAHCG